MSEKPLLRTAEHASAGRDRGSSYNVVKEGVNLIPDYGENSDSEDDDKGIKKKPKAKGSSWWPSFCPCGRSFTTLG